MFLTLLCTITPNSNFLRLRPIPKTQKILYDLSKQKKKKKKTTTTTKQTNKQKTKQNKKQNKTKKEMKKKKGIWTYSSEDNMWRIFALFRTTFRWFYVNNAILLAVVDFELRAKN